MKPKVYIETSVVSYLTAHPSNDLRAMANQNATVEWWDLQRAKYDLVISEFVIAEASLGNPEAARRRLAVLDDIAELKATEKVRLLGRELVNLGALPVKAEVDAFHANARTRPRIESVCRAMGYEPPIICTPDELMEH